MYSRSSDLLYCSADDELQGSWSTHQRVPNIPYRFGKQSDTSVPNPPPDSITVDVVRDTSTTLRAVTQCTMLSSPAPPIPENPTSYSTFLQTLCPTERSLLENVTFSDPFSTFDHIMTTWRQSAHQRNNVMRIATSDGSVKDGKGTFGWLLSNADGERLVQCNGKAHGYPMTSYRAEAFGMWSILLFMIKGFEFLQLPTSPQILELYCDNEALVKKINTLIVQARPVFPNETLQSDWDIVYEIVRLLKISLQKVSWIKGHQDEDIPKDQLSLPAQLNCEADELAELAHSLPFNFNSKFRSPHNPIQVYHRDQPVTSKLKRTLRRMIKSPPLQDYILKKITWWTPTIFHMVDWEAHARAISSSSLPDRFVTKFIHDLLPTGKRVHRYKPFYDHRCPSCYREYEDHFHCFTCEHEDRIKWRPPLLKDVRDFCRRTFVSNDLTTLLIDGIESYFTDSHLEYPPRFPDHLYLLISEQEDIGWDQLILGRFSLKWRKCHQDDLCRRGIEPTRHNSGLQWVSALLQIIWRHFHGEWLTRNQARHGVDAAEQAIKQRQQNIAELSMYYNYRDDRQLLRSELHSTSIFYSSLQEHLHRESSNSQLDTWLCSYRHILIHSHQQALQRERVMPHMTPPQSPPRLSPPHIHHPISPSSPEDLEEINLGSTYFTLTNTYTHDQEGYDGQVDTLDL